MISKEELLKSDLRKNGLTTLLEKIERDILFNHEKGFNRLETRDIAGTVYAETIIKVLEDKGFKIEFVDINSPFISMEAGNRKYHKISWEEDSLKEDFSKMCHQNDDPINEFDRLIDNYEDEVCKRGIVYADIQTVEGEDCKRPNEETKQALQDVEDGKDLKEIVDTKSWLNNLQEKSKEFKVNVTGEAFLLYIENNVVICNCVTFDEELKTKIRNLIIDELKANSISLLPTNMFVAKTIS